MSDTESRWLTYAELGQIIGRTPSGARMFASRRGWPKRTPNKIGERTSVLVPAELAETPARAARGRNGGVLANGTEERAIARAAIDALTEQLAIANRCLDEERAYSARAMERAAALQTRINELQAALADERRRVIEILTRPWWRRWFR